MSVASSVLVGVEVGWEAKKVPRPTVGGLGEVGEEGLEGGPPVKKAVPMMGAPESVVVAVFLEGLGSRACSSCCEGLSPKFSSSSARSAGAAPTSIPWRLDMDPAILVLKPSMLCSGMWSTAVSQSTILSPQLRFCRSRGRLW